MKVKVVKSDPEYWYEVGGEHDVCEHGSYTVKGEKIHFLVDDDLLAIKAEDFVAVNEENVEDEQQEWVNNPKHYHEHPSGIACIDVVEHMTFNLGNAMKYIWRCDLKRDAIEDLKKAVWYVQREIEKREKEAK